MKKETKICIHCGYKHSNKFDYSEDWDTVKDECFKCGCIVRSLDPIFYTLSELYKNKGREITISYTIKKYGKAKDTTTK